ncbi:hypothetical protein BAU15_13065 [Enterococcus sp. JM4C]|uniref:hypothetical protein n=1 Tax=Candidatus Enterococcus huntleyi TaxID=1857217 RepID=UPI00137A46DC|nr:hypothetical protein [Enterococcus sp. JM4C]KAF1297692.1 hypothetical protein BAU15_13065 [Enterococcus sp. JM4C]
MTSLQTMVQQFLADLDTEEQVRLYNDLLALEAVHHLNEHASFYTFRKLKRATHRHFECRKRTLRFVNKKNNELIIHQLHEQHIFKNHYRIQVFYNLHEYDFKFVEELTTALRKNNLIQPSGLSINYA